MTILKSKSLFICAASFIVGTTTAFAATFSGCPQPAQNQGYSSCIAVQVANSTSKEATILNEAREQQAIVFQPSSTIQSGDTGSWYYAFENCTPQTSPVNLVVGYKIGLLGNCIFSVSAFCDAHNNWNLSSNSASCTTDQVRVTGALGEYAISSSGKNKILF